MLTFAKNNKMKIANIQISKINTALTEPFVIAIETITHAESIVVKITTDTGIIGWGECNPYRSIAGETQATCYESGLFLAKILRDLNPTNIVGCHREMDKMMTGNKCIKSAFDMAFYDIAAKAANMPLYRFLGGENNRHITTDMTVGINTPQYMAASAAKYKAQGFRAIKVKLGTNKKDDVARIHAIREAIGNEMPLRIDANQGWD